MYFDTSLFGARGQVGVVRGPRRDSGAASGSNYSEPRNIAGATGRWHRFKPAYRFQEFLFAPSTKIDSFHAKGALARLSNVGADGLTVAAETSVEQLLDLVVDSEVDHALMLNQPA